jgi:hypothetical protein
MGVLPKAESSEAAKMARGQWLVRKGRLGDPELETQWPPTTPEERLAMVWPLTIQAWALRGEDVSKRPFARDVVRIFRRKRRGSTER